jgi:hypothetical protein
MKRSLSFYFSVERFQQLSLCLPVTIKQRRPVYDGFFPEFRYTSNSQSAGELELKPIPSLICFYLNQGDACLFGIGEQDPYF